MSSLTDAARSRQASSDCTPGVLCVLPPGRQSKIRTPVVETIAIAVIDDESRVRWRICEAQVYINRTASDLSLRINSPLALVHAPAMYGQ
jgi:hypothetical protein